MKFRLILISLLILSLSCGCSSIKTGISSFMIDVEMKRAGLNEKTVTVNDHGVPFFERDGKGPVIVLVHGFSSDKKDWIRFSACLPEKYHIIALDLPGHGENTTENLACYDPPALSRGVGRIVDAMGLKKFHLVGNSLGGLVSKLYARAHPNRVITLGLFDSAGVMPSVPGDFFDALQKGDNPFDVNTREDYEELKAYAFHKIPFIPWPLDGIMAQKRIARNEFYQMVFKQLHAHPAFIDPDYQTAVLESLSMPVLVAWGDRDRILNVSSINVYARHIKNLQTVVLKECGHLPMIERPEETARQYAAFLSKY